MNWSVPPIWRGDTVAILASGPSMSQPVADRVRAAGLPAIVVNSTFRLAPWADMLYAADAGWWAHNPDALGFAGLKVSVSPVNGVCRLRNTGVLGFDPDPTAVRTGGNSGYQAVHIAAQAGAARILLLGFDMTAARGSHWHGDHPAPLRNTEREHYSLWTTHFGLLALELDARGIEVLNCTPGSALTCFSFANIKDVLHGQVESFT